jgi:energy-coupling factor transporter ATP-binding protein EcfA2
LPGEEGEAGVGLLEAYLRRQRELHARYRGRVEEADSIARRLAASIAGVPAVVARVAASHSSIEADMPPEAWLLIASDQPEALAEGYYYLIVDPKTRSIILARVEAVERLPLLEQKSQLHVPLEKPHPLTIASNVSPIRLHLAPMLSIHLGEESAAELAEGRADPAELLAALEPSSTTPPPDPGAPVVIPAPNVLSAVLAPRGDVTVGGLAVGDRPYTPGGEAVPVELPWSVLVKHVLVTGTTGSGKTSLVKNMLYSALHRVKGLHALVLDASGDYAAAGLPGIVPEGMAARYAPILRLYGYRVEGRGPLEGYHLNVLSVIPCYQADGGCRGGEAAESYASYLLETAKAMYSRWGCSVEMEGGVSEAYGGVYRACYRVECGSEHRACVHIAPGRIHLQTLAQLASIDPYMTERARDALPYIVSRTGAGSIDELLDRLSNPAAAEKDLGVHRQTLAHLASRLRVIKSLKLVDVGRPRGPTLDYGGLVAKAAGAGADTVVVDLAYAASTAPGDSNPTAVRVLLAYHTLRTMLSHAEKTPEHRALLVVDEAHTFFPRSGEAYERMLTATIERLARLGRSRGIAIIFSTHREQDLSPAVQTLANTRIYLRTDRRTAEELPLPRDLKNRLPYMADHTGILASYAARGGYLQLAGAPTPLGHRTA